MQRIILLTIISNLCLQCISHPYPSMQNVEIVDIESDGSNQSDNYERVFVKIAQNYRKINEKQKSSGHHHENSHKSSANCGYEVRFVGNVASEILMIKKFFVE